VLIQTGNFHAEFWHPDPPEAAISDLLAVLSARLGPLGYSCQRNGSTLTISRGRTRGRWLISRPAPSAPTEGLSLTVRAFEEGTKVAAKGQIGSQAAEIIDAVAGGSSHITA
jgi:hypothetical protein